MIQGCAISLLEFDGREVHDLVVKMCFESDVFVVNNLISMYGNCGNVDGARKVFDECPMLELHAGNVWFCGEGR